MSPRLIGAAACLVAAFLAGWVIQGWRYKGEIAQIRADYAAAEVKRQADARKTDASRQSGMDEAAEKGAIAIEDNRVIDRTDGAAADRLRDELAAVRRHFTRENSRLATASATAQQTILVLSELYQGSVARERELAAAFEESRARGLTCEAGYDSLMP